MIRVGPHSRTTCPLAGHASSSDAANSLILPDDLVPLDERLTIASRSVKSAIPKAFSAEQVSCTP